MSPEKLALYTDANLKRDSIKQTTVGPYTVWVAAFGTGPHTWDYSQALVYRGDTQVLEAKRNYHPLWWALIQDHQVTHHDYFVTSEHYWGSYSFFDLTTGSVARYSPKGDGSINRQNPDTGKWEPTGQDDRWCWGDIYPSPGGTCVLVQGCYWAGPWTLRAYDTTDPTTMPLPWLVDGEAGKATWNYASVEVLGWEDEDHARISFWSSDAAGAWIDNPVADEKHPFYDPEAEDYLREEGVLNVRDGTYTCTRAPAAV